MHIDYIWQVPVARKRLKFKRGSDPWLTMRAVPNLVLKRSSDARISKEVGWLVANRATGERLVP
jgi:hypothetical protein